MSKAATSKPAKSYPEFPLTAHANGQWCKKICGRVHYFGAWADPQAALNLYLDQRDDLRAFGTEREIGASFERQGRASESLARLVRRRIS